MIDIPLPQERHQLDRVLALQAYAAACTRDPVSAKAAVCAAFGLSGDLNDELLLCAMLLLAYGRFTEGKQILLQVALADASKIQPVYDIAASVFKYFNAGMSIPELARFGVDLVLQVYQHDPRSADAQRALLDLLLYFGSADDAERILLQAGAAHLQDEMTELQCYRQRLADYRDQYRLSIVLITYQRPALLQATLAGLREQLGEQDVEIIIGVNDDWPQTRQVIEQAGIDKVFFNDGNAGINLYKQVFPMASGEYIIEIDDDIQAFPAGFDRQIIACLQARPDLGLVGHWPAGFHDLTRGQALPAAESVHARCEVAGLPFGIGPVAGACAGMRRRDFLTINGFSRASLSKYSGEEPQLIRKLSMYGKISGVIFDQGLIVNVTE